MLQLQYLLKRQPNVVENYYICVHIFAYVYYMQFGNTTIHFKEKNPRDAREQDDIHVVLRNVQNESEAFVDILSKLMLEQNTFRNPFSYRIQNFIDAEKEFLRIVLQIDDPQLVSFFLKKMDAIRKSYELVLLDEKQLGITEIALRKKIKQLT